MKVLFKITEEEFNEIFSEMAENHEWDFYDQPHSNGYSLIKFENTLTEDRVKFFHEVFSADKPENMSYSMVSTHLDPTSPNWMVNYKLGYTSHKDGYIYSTSKWNRHGVWKDPKTGICYAFYYGCRSRITDLPMFGEFIAKGIQPDVYETSVPEMFWYETNKEYTERMNARKY